MTTSPECACEWEKIVIHLRSEIIKGYVQTRGAASVEAVLSDAAPALPGVLAVRRVGSEVIEEISIEQAKAIFYVNSFEGTESRKELRFHTRAPIMQAVWVRVEFTDGEVMEGLVDNTLRYLVDPGFFLRPTDPYSNSRLVYVLKRWLKDCRVLGLRER
jgi:hypothetical protein